MKRLLRQFVNSSLYNLIPSFMNPPCSSCTDMAVGLKLISNNVHFFQFRGSSNRFSWSKRA